MRAHGGDLRRGRYSQQGGIYLITTCTCQRRPLFHDFHLGRLVVQALRRAEEMGQARSLAWVVMPDHLHWLLQLERLSLYEVMRNVKCHSARAINTRLGCRGAVWQADFHDRGIRREADLLPAARYIIANPLRAGLVASVREYSLWDCCWL